MLDIQPVEYDADFPGATFYHLAPADTEINIDARYQISKTIDGSAYVNVSTVTDAGREFIIEIERATQTEENRLRDICLNGIEIIACSTRFLYPVKGYLVGLAFGNGRPQVKIAVAEMLA